MIFKMVTFITYVTLKLTVIDILTSYIFLFDGVRHWVTTEHYWEVI